VDKKRFEDYQAQTKATYPANMYDPITETEKHLEHFVALDLLKLRPEDIFIDVASAGSPVSEIYHRLAGCRSFMQDLIYPEGINGNVIGGDAAKMPLPNRFASAMALHCSFEHFEGDSDSNFIHEVNRVLKGGGRCCILPLYLTERYSIQTDPSAHPSMVINDYEAEIYHAIGWGNRHGRFYSPEKLRERVGAHLGEQLKITIHEVHGTPKGCYLKYAALLEKLQEKPRSWRDYIPKF
jgi:SAM-dependent methyltransferase